jgi:hypothetical protein
VIPKSQASAVQLHDASRAALQHFDGLTHADAELLQTVHFIGLAEQRIDAGALTGRQHLQGERVRHGWKAGDSGRLIETESHYAKAFYGRLQQRGSADYAVGTT